MKLLLLSVSLLLSGSLLVQPSDLTVSVNVLADDVDVLARELVRVNKRERVNELPFTLETWLQREFQQVIRLHVSRGAAADRDVACETLLGLPAVAAGLRQQLGGVIPCG